MNAPSPAPVRERLWLSYAKAALFILPAVIAGNLARDRLMPKAKEICQYAGFEPSHLGHAGWIWPATFWLAHWGQTLLVAGIVGLVLMELISPRWWRRRLVLGVGVWMVNLTVLFGLCVLLTIIIIVAAGLTPHR